MRARRYKQPLAAGKKERTDGAAKKQRDEKVYIVDDERKSGWLGAFLQNPNLVFQMVVILMTLFSGNGRMERSIESMGTTVEKMKNIADLLNQTMGNMQEAAKAPREIRRMLENR